MSGDLAKADGESLQIVSSGAALEPVWATKFRLQRAKIWIYQGRSSEALPLLESTSSGTPLDPALAVTRSSLLAIAYARTGNLNGAEQVLSGARGQCQGQSSWAIFYLAQGLVDLQSASLTDAEQAFQRSLISARASADKFLETQALLDLGVVALRQEHFDDALDRFTHASTIANAIGARQALEKATASVGGALSSLGDQRGALANYRLAEKQAAELGSTLDQVRLLNDSGLSLYRLGDLVSARSSYERSLQLAQSIHNPEVVGDALVALATLSFQTGDLSDALKRSSEAQQVIERRGVSSDTLRPLLITALVWQREGKVSAAKTQLVELQQRSSVSPSVRWEVENALARLSVSVGDYTSADAWFRRAIQTFRRQRYSVRQVASRLPFVENGTSLYLSYMEFLIHAGKLADALTVLDQGRAETLAEGLAQTEITSHGASRPTTPAPMEVARRVNGTVLVYSLQPTTSYLWAITASHLTFHRLPGKEILLPLVEAHNRAVLSSKEVLSQGSAPGFALYHSLIEPAGKLITSGGNVFIIADQEMNGLNFETLLSPFGSPHFWIEDVTIVNARSLSLLAKRRITVKASLGSNRLLLVGDPISGSQEYKRLPHALEEVSNVAQHFSPQGRLVLAGSQATPAAYRSSRPGEFAYIHFVAHATASEISPLDSAVILSPNVGDIESYKLYARDILDQQLHANLVTISSCYGSGVRSYSGEGLVGLAWAFLRAGSHYVIGALWEVDDVSTPYLMQDLYDALGRGDNPAEALRSAKLRMIHRGGVFRKPFYWAPFQLYVGA